jgi:DNA-binding HxlR family transcriptional regulator
MKSSTHTNCAVSKTATLLSDPWTMLIIRDLLKTKMRFCELERSLEGISTRTLTLKLKRLESESIVTKIDDVHYALTTTGKKLKKVINAMESWGENYK